MEPLSPDLYENTKNKFIPELVKFFSLLHKRGKMYMIANEMLVIHSGIPVGTDGSLIPPQRKGISWTGFDGVVGLDALDKIEAGVRSLDPNILHWLGNGSSKDMTPAWVRDPFFKVMVDPQPAKRVISELSIQAKIRGSDIKGILIGHTESTQESVANRRKVLGSGFGYMTYSRGCCRFNYEEWKDVQVNTRHNFGKPAPLSYELTNSL